MLPKTLLKNSNDVVSYEEHYLNVKNGNIIDPTLVIKSTIQNAIGAAIMIFTTDCVIHKEERK
jgi:chaperonin GroEL (HSP60 family)